MIYLDNAATSYPKPDRVYEEIERCMREYCANPGRGGHQMSIKAGRAVLEARDAVCRLFNIDSPMQLSFMKNATEAINTAIYGFLKQGDHVVTTSMEHNSVIRPLRTLEKSGVIQLTVIKGGSHGEIDPYNFKKSVRKNTAMFAVTLSSNVNGTVMPVQEIGETASECGSAFLLDASQGAGSMKLDVNALKVDLLAFPGHKGLLGPQGTGGLYVREGIRLKPLIQGGTGSNSENQLQPEFMPDVLESGTLNTPGLVGLRYGVEFLEGIGLENISMYKGLLLEHFINGLEQIKGITIYSLKSSASNSGIAAVNIDRMDSNEVSHILDREFGIATRAGLHCSPLAHETLGTLGKGVVRFSLGCFNTLMDIDRAVDAMDEIAFRRPK